MLLCMYICGFFYSFIYLYLYLHIKYGRTEETVVVSARPVQGMMRVGEERPVLYHEQTLLYRYEIRNETTLYKVDP